MYYFPIFFSYLNYPELNPQDNLSYDNQPLPPEDAVTTGATTSAQRKVIWFFNYFNDIAKKIWSPSRELAVDESMVAHKGRTQHLQYMPAKPTKWGLKVWMVAESATGIYFFLTISPLFAL